MERKKIILSYDYELFFGDMSGTVQKSIIEPTYKILNALESVGLKGSFFVDWQMLKYLREANTERTKEDLKLITEQLHDIVYRGHRIELHIHPHWVDAKYNGDGTWNFSDFSHYMLSTFNEVEITSMFVEGCNLLNNIAREVEPNYSIIAFRAGGWAVQPFPMLKEAFRASGIKIDSSTSFGAFNLKEDQKYDFRKMPKKAVYRFSEDVTIEDAKGEFIEVPISSYKQNFVLKMIRKLKERRGMLERSTDGVHTRVNDPLKINNNPSLIERLINSYPTMFSHSQFPAENILIASFFHRDDVICVIDHPKDFSKETVRGIKAMRHVGRACTYLDIYNEFADKK